MTPTIFLYVMIFTALIAGAAAAAEWGVQGRTPLRHFWTVAIVLALAAPPAILAVHARQSAPVELSGTPVTSSADVTTFVMDGARQTARATGTAGRMRALERRVRNLERLVTPAVVRRMLTATFVLWIGASLVLLGWIVAGLLHWRRERSAWEPATVDGIAVELSPNTGPAVLGVLSQRIVLPSWATAMEPQYRTLMLAHECEHIRARDPQRLALALGALVLMPWNLALWWCAARLRRAIELDCDARVLRAHPTPKAYGYLLLEVAARGRNTGALAVPLVGLLHLPSELEMRLRAMTRPRSIARRTLAVAGVLTVGALSAAFAAPVPRAAAFDRTDSVATATMPAAPIMDRETTVYIGGTKLTLHRATYSGATRRVEGRMVRLSIDTIPARDSIAKLNRELDSVRTRLRELEARRANPVYEIPGPDSIAAKGLPKPQYTITIQRHVDSMARPLSTEDREVQTEHMLEFTARADSVAAKMYPDLIAHPDPHVAIWVVSDHTGHVVRTARGEIGANGRLSANAIEQQFPDVRPDDIAAIEIRKKSPLAGPGAVIWITLKK